MLKAVKYCLYPTESQKVLLDKHIGSVRFIYNLALETKKIAYVGNQVNLSCFDLIKQLPELKKECEWLKEINSQTLQQSVTNLDTAYTNFFKGTAKFPRYKSKKRGMFTQMLKYKVEWYGVNIIQIGTFESSSKTYSNCGYIHKELKLSDREWKCGRCGVNHNRDINAALNIKNFALRNYVSGTDTQTHSELPTLVGVLTYEASSPLGKR